MGKLMRVLMNCDALIIAVDSTDIVAEAKRIHSLSPVMCAALGRVLTAAAIMGARLKSDGDALTLTVNGGGPAGNLVACADAHPYVRGYAGDSQVNLPPTDAGKLDVSGAVGSDGFITVTRDVGLREPYTGRVRIVSGEIAEDIVQYFAVSEQTPCAMALSVQVDKDLSVGGASGIAAFPLPGASEKTLSYLEERLSAMQEFAGLLRGGAALEDAVAATYPDCERETLDETDAAYRCTCSRERLLSVLASLGRDELTDMIEHDGGAEVSCRFCDTLYTFSKEDLEELLK